MNLRSLAGLPGLVVALTSAVSAAPTVSILAPASGSTVASLTSIGVTFSEPVSNVEVVDLQVNGAAASGLTGSGAGPYVFTFSQPGPGEVSVAWEADHGIAGTAGTGSFVPAGSWGYTLIDAIAPTVGRLPTTVSGQEMDAIFPSPNATVADLAGIEVTFSEPVTGVDAADVGVNGVAATGLSGTGAGPYAFVFPAPGNGPVSFRWAETPGIVDAAGNPFAGGGAWSVIKAPSLGTVVITEFLAANAGGVATTVKGTRDEDFDLSPWVELTNAGATPVDLTGWSLTDDLEKPDQWIIPARTLAPESRLVVWCSGKDRKPASGHLHTNFHLGTTGGTIALFAPGSPRGPAASVFAGYPSQRYDYSYGVQATDGAARFFSPPSVTQPAYTLPSPSNPTPAPPAVPQGAANGSSALVSVAPNPTASVSRGFFNEPFPLILSCAAPGAIVQYTLDGTPPTAASPAYAGPLTIASTTVLRMAAFAPDSVPSESITHSYLFLDSVMAQPSPPYDNPANANDNANPQPPAVGGTVLPVAWGTNGTGGFPGQITNLTANQVPADYGMDPRVHADPTKYTDAGVIDPDAGRTNAERIHQALRALPMLSVVMKTGDMWGPGGLYPTASESDKTDRTKPCSLELLLPDGTTGFAVSCGIDLHGNASRAPYKNPKHGFTLRFKGRFGSGKLAAALFPDSPVREWDKLVLRGDFNSGWVHWDGGTQRPKGLRIRDAWSKDSFRDMGRMAGHHRYTNLFINGVYWGTYDLAEDQADDFAASYFGGSKGDYDIMEQGVLKSGTRTVYNAMAALPITAGNNAQYEAMKAVLDVPWFIDYMPLHFLTGHQDWGGDINKNWYAARNRNNGKYRYLPWDQENLLWNPTDNSTGVTSPPTGLHTKLVNHGQYKLDFADRVHRHLVAPDGALTPAANLARLNKWTGIMNADAMCLESARWGDYRNAVHRYSSGTYNEVYTWSGKWYEGGNVRSNTANTNNWLSEANRLRNAYFPVRSQNVVGQLRTRGLYPSLNAPQFRDGSDALAGSQRVAAGWLLKMTLPTPAPTGTTSAGTIWFTTDGSDPRVYYDTTGATNASAAAYATPIPIVATTTVKARALNGTTWSALMEGTFSVGSPLPPVRITEINYNPNPSQGGAAAEFVEIQNTGATAVDLGTWHFDGIEFIFPVGQRIGPGDRLVIASNNAPATFRAQYPGVVVTGYFGASLDNGGERLSLRDTTGRLISSVLYDDVFPWPTAADNGGYSIEVIDPDGDLRSAYNWKASSVLKGTPGAPNGAPWTSVVVINEFLASGGGHPYAGANADYVELSNPGVAPVRVGNWTLRSSRPEASVTLPVGTQIAGGGYLAVLATPAGVPGPRLPSVLDPAGGELSLSDAGGVRIDGVSYGPQAFGFSFGRNGSGWKLNQRTPGAANVVQPTAPRSQLRLNEWLASPVPGEDGWVELTNLDAALPVLLRGLLVERDGEPHAVNVPAALGSGCQARFYCDPEGQRQDAILLNLPAAGAVLRLRDADGSLIDSVSYGVQRSAVSEGRLPDGTGPVTALAFPSPGQPNRGIPAGTPVLNEVLVLNRTGANAPWARRPSWIELRNPGVSSVSLGGWRLRTLGDEPREWTIPAGVALATGAPLALWCDPVHHPASTTAAMPLNSGLALDDGYAHWGLELITPLGQTADRIAWGHQLPDRSIGRLADGSWALLAAPTIGDANSPAADLGSATALRLNEWLARTEVGSGPEFLELFNAGAAPVALGGLWLSDEPSEVGRRKWQIPALSFIDAGGYAGFWPADATRRPLAPNFHLDATGEALRLGLDDPATTALDFVGFGLAPPLGSSEGRQPDGSGTTGALIPTPGAPNGSGPGPVFTLHPHDTAVALGQALDLVAEAPSPASFQWRRNGVDLPGETGSTFHRAAASLADDAKFTCMATNGSGTATSRAALVMVLYTYDLWAAALGIGPAAGDADGDGVSNGAEFLAGTDPLVASIADRAAAPRPVGLQTLGGVGYFSVDATLDPRAAYSQVLGELSPTFAPGSWIAKPPDRWETLSTDPGGARRMRLRFAIPAGSPHHFLRLAFVP